MLAATFYRLIDFQHYDKPKQDSFPIFLSCLKTKKDLFLWATIVVLGLESLFEVHHSTRLALLTISAERLEFKARIYFYASIFRKLSPSPMITRL